MLPAFGSRVYVPAAVHQPNDANALYLRLDDPRLFVQIYRLVRRMPCSKRRSGRPHKCSATRKCPQKATETFKEATKPRNAPYFEISTPPVAPRIYGIVSHVTQGSSEGGLAYSLDITVDGELTSSQGSDHEKTSTKTTKAAPHAEFFCDLDQAAGGAFAR
jgi:hypothetical protein